MSRKTVAISGDTLRAFNEKVDKTLGEGGHKKISEANAGLLLIQWALINIPEGVWRQICINAQNIRQKNSFSLLNVEPSPPPPMMGMPNFQPNFER